MNVIKFRRSIRQSDVLSFKCTQSISTGPFSFAELAPDRNANWNRAVIEARKTVDYPSSFFNLRQLLTDEAANFPFILLKLAGSNHPLLKIVNSKNTIQINGLIILLVSKAAEHSPNSPDSEQDRTAGILHSQRTLAEITELIRTSYVINKSLVNLQQQSENYSSMLFGNQISLLSGGYLLTRSFAKLASLKNQELQTLIAAAIRDQSDGEFVGLRDKQNFPLPDKPRKINSPVDTIGDCTIAPLVVLDILGDAKAEWTLRHVLSSGSLLGKSCQGTLKLAGHSPKLQEQGYFFGKHLALAMQACLDRKRFQSPKNETFSLVSAPVMFQLEHDPDLYSEIEKGMEDVMNVDYDLIREAVLSGPGVEKTRQLQKEHSEAAVEFLQQLPPSDALTALTNIIIAMNDL